MSEEQAMRFAHVYGPRALQVRHAIKRGPGGRYLSKCVPVPDLADWPDGAAGQLSPDQMVEWTIMDTHDWFATRYDLPLNGRPSTPFSFLAVATTQMSP